MGMAWRWLVSTQLAAGTCATVTAAEHAELAGRWHPHLPRHHCAHKRVTRRSGAQTFRLSLRLATTSGRPAAGVMHSALVSHATRCTRAPCRKLSATACSFARRRSAVWLVRHSPFDGPSFPAGVGSLLWNYSWPLSEGDGVFNHVNVPVVTASGVAVFQTAHVANIGANGASKVVAVDVRTGQPVWNASTGQSGTCCAHGDRGHGIRCWLYWLTCAPTPAPQALRGL